MSQQRPTRQFHSFSRLADLRVECSCRYSAGYACQLAFSASVPAKGSQPLHVTLDHDANQWAQKTSAQTRLGLESSPSRKSQRIQLFSLAENQSLACQPGLPGISVRAEELPMSFVAWQILRRMPKPLLLVCMIFMLATAARA